jgi:serine/threonine-protein kinase
MVCEVCGTERATDAAACPVCGTSPDGPTVAAASSPGSVPSALSSGIDHGAFTPGTLLGTRYRIVGLLGRGGMGEVYRADDLTLGQPVALKFLRGDDPALAARLRQETRTARQVSHPNVCRVHDVAEWSGRSFVSMEYIDGEDLASLLRRIGRLPEDKAVEIVRQVCAGLAAAHDRGVLHRDLKPANVMLDARGKVRITDFGLASFADDQGQGEIAGTPAYMAPEQVLGGRLSPQTDLYAVGLLLFELLAGSPALRPLGLAERRQQPALSTSSLSPSVRATINARILHVIDRCLEPDAARRPESALQLSAALPGGDPLAAALAAGETPAPHVVADAPDDSSLSPAAAVGCLVAFAATIVALGAVTGRDVYSRFVPFRNSPEVLAARAEEVRQHLGYADIPNDTAHGFRTFPGYLGWLRARTTGPADYTRLRSLRPQLVVFWYRTSAHPLLPPPRSLFLGPPLAIMASSPEPIPPIDLAPPGRGETYLELDPDGALNALVATPLEGDPRAPQGTAIDWTRLFMEARLDATRFSSVEPSFVSPVWADSRAAWTGPAPDASGVELRIEAAALAGRPVYFRIKAPWTREAQSSIPAIGTALFNLIFVVLIGVGAVLAKRNLQAGRSDLRGAARVALTVALALLGAQLLQAHRPFSAVGIFVFIGAVSSTLFMGASTWLVYVALEPYVRKYWPHALIAWTRLLAGRWRDRRVGRDLLIGALVGLGPVVIDRAAAWLANWRSGLSVLWRVDFDALSSASGLAARFLGSIAAATCLPICILFFLMLIRLLSRRPWAAVLIATATPVLLSAGTFTDPLLQLPLALLSFAIPVLLLTHYGLLAGVSALFMDMMSSVVVSLDFSSFFAGTMVAGVLLLAAPAIVGFYVTIAGRSLVGRRFELGET